VPKSRSFSDSVCFQEQLCEKGLAPKMITTPEFGSIANYSYHLDAAKFAEFLQKHCCEKLGVRHVLAQVESVISSSEGDIAGVQTDTHGTIEGDLFVDCTGFRSMLLGQHYQVPFKDCSDILQIDTALAMQVPYDDDDAPIACHTISTAQSAGWIWDIGLRERRGIGHVFSSDHISADQAERQLRDYIGPSAKHTFGIKTVWPSGSPQAFLNHLKHPRLCSLNFPQQ